MKKLLPLLLTLLVLSACAPAAPTETPTPAPSATASPIPPTPTQTIIPTATFPSPPSSPTPVAYTTRVFLVDHMIQVFIPAGSFQMGGFDVHAENDELPARKVTLDGYWLDQFEVTNGMYSLCVQAGVCRPPQTTRSNQRPEYFGNPEFVDYPVIAVTWSDASAYCEWAGRRLPTEAEWERAARGDEDLRTFPWGEEPPSGLYANFNNLIRDTSRIGSYPLGVSPFGAYDLAGNVAEWVQDLYKLDYYLNAPLSNPTGPAPAPLVIQRVIRGGSYQDVWVNIRVANRGYEQGPNPAAAFDSLDLYGRSSNKIGFRCAADE